MSARPGHSTCTPGLRFPRAPLLPPAIHSPARPGRRHTCCSAPPQRPPATCRPAPRRPPRPARRGRCAAGPLPAGAQQHPRTPRAPRAGGPAPPQAPTGRTGGASPRAGSGLQGMVGVAAECGRRLWNDSGEGRQAGRQALRGSESWRWREDASPTCRSQRRAAVPHSRLQPGEGVQAASGRHRQDAAHCKPLHRLQHHQRCRSAAVTVAAACRPCQRGVRCLCACKHSLASARQRCAGVVTLQASGDQRTDAAIAGCGRGRQGEGREG